MSVFGIEMARSGRPATWLEAIRRSGLDVERHCLRVAGDSELATIAVLARGSILERCYFGDYHTDVFDLRRLVEAVRTGDESILLWGEPDALERLHAWSRDGRRPTAAELRELALGTHSVLATQDVYGEGHVELSRTGSVCSTVPAAGPIAWDVSRVVADAPAFGTHAVVGLPRNRRRAAGVPGGEAIHRLHVRELRSCFWGVAPWYVMAGGFLEVLDYRELYVDLDRAWAAATLPARLTFATESAAAFADALLTLNLGSFRPTVALWQTRAIPDARWQLHRQPTQELQAYGPAVARPAADGVVELPPLAYEGQGPQHDACWVVFVPLEPRWTGLQAELEERGFRLTMLMPPKRPAGAAGHPKWLGAWARPRVGIPLAAPYYLGSGLLGPEERRIAEYIQCAIAAWSSARTVNAEEIGVCAD